MVNEAKSTYDDWGNVEKYEEDRDSAVGASGSVNDYEVSYTYAKATGGRNTVRRTGATLPSGKALTYEYVSVSSQLDSDASRLTRVKDGATVLVEYQYLGVGDVVGTIHDQPDTMWKMYTTSGTYPDLDRFNRVVTSRWTKDLATDKDFYRVDLAYDRNSNITSADEQVHSGFDVLYLMDDVDRLVDAEEGTLSGGSISSRKRHQIWTLNHTGNWDREKLDLDGDDNWNEANEHDDTRTHNTVNELTNRDTNSSSPNEFDLVYDPAGNLTDDDENYKYEYDAFYRLRKVKNTGTSALVAEYTYNGNGHRIGLHEDTDTDGDVDSSDLWYYTAYDERWRPLSTFRSNDSSAKEEFVPHQAGLGGHGGSSYINSVVCRYKDTSTAWTSASDGTLEEIRYYCQNWRGDVSSLVTDGGWMKEWVKYSSYGVPFGLPAADTNSDGVRNSADTTQIQAWIDAASYDVRGDWELDGDVDSQDKAFAQASTATLGRELLSDVGNRFGFAGYEFHATRQYHIRQRVLAPFGRWLSRDPYTYADGTSLYEYAMSRPIYYSDPLGTQCDQSQNPIPPSDAPIVIPCPSTKYPVTVDYSWTTQVGSNAVGAPSRNPGSLVAQALRAANEYEFRHQEAKSQCKKQGRDKAAGAILSVKGRTVCDKCATHGFPCKKYYVGRDEEARITAEMGRIYFPKPSKVCCTLRVKLYYKCRCTATSSYRHSEDTVPPDLGGGGDTTPGPKDDPPPDLSPPGPITVEGATW